MAEKLQPDLLLLDLNLPKMHGFEAAEQVRRLAPHARLLFMSHESSPDIVRQAFSLGGHGYIQKISAATDLLPAIDAVLAGQLFVSRSLAFTEPADPPALRRHEILFCSDDAAIIDGFTRFVAAALHAADAVIALVTESHRTRLLEELRTQGVDIDGAIERGTCLSFDADVAPDPVRFSRGDQRCACGRRESRERTSPRRVLRGTCGTLVGRRQNRGGGSARTTLQRARA